MQYNSADGQLNKIFGSVQGSAKKLTDDVKTLFNPNKKQEENNDASSNIFFEEDTNDDVRSEQTVQQVEVTTQSTTSTTTPQSVAKNETTGQDGKDGRENFSGGCLTGYMRTADGRCKPTF